MNFNEDERVAAIATKFDKKHGGAKKSGAFLFLVKTYVTKIKKNVAYVLWD